MATTTHNLLHKISYIEADIEIQKQILFSLSDDNKQEIEKIIKNIAESKKEIQRLRDEIEKISPDEHQRILKIEKSVEKFKAIAAEKKFSTINNMASGDNCSLKLSDGKTVNCLVRAKDDHGNYTAITIDGELVNISAEEVASDS